MNSKYLLVDHGIGILSSLAVLFTKVNIKEIMSISQHLSKCIENSMKNMHTDVKFQCTIVKG